MSEPMTREAMIKALVKDLETWDRDELVGFSRTCREEDLRDMTADMVKSEYYLAFGPED